MCGEVAADANEDVFGFGAVLPMDGLLEGGFEGLHEVEVEVFAEDGGGEGVDEAVEGVAEAEVEGDAGGDGFEAAAVVEVFEDFGQEVVGVFGEAFEVVGAFAGDAGFGDVEEAVGVDGHGDVEEAAEVAAAGGAPEALAEGVAVSEGVDGVEPVVDVVGLGEAGEPEGGDIGEFAGEGERVRSRFEGFQEAVEDGLGVFAEEDGAELGGVGFRGGGEFIGEGLFGVFDEGDEVDGVAPCAALLFATGGGHAGNEGGEDGAGVVPADGVEEFEGFVGKVEGVAGVGVDALVEGTEDEVVEEGGMGEGPGGGEEGALAAVAVADEEPAVEPALELRGVGGIVFEVMALAAGGLAAAVAGDAAGGEGEAVDGGFCGEVGPEAGHESEAGHAVGPIVVIGGAEEGDVADDVEVGDAGVEEADDAFGLNEADVLLEAALEAGAVVWLVGLFAGHGGEVDVAAVDAGVVGGDVVGEEVEGAATAEVEAGMVPVAGEEAIVDGAFVEGEAEVGAAVVDGMDAVMVPEEGDGAVGGADLDDAAGFEVSEGGDFDVFWVIGHGWFWVGGRGEVEERQRG